MRVRLPVALKVSETAVLDFFKDHRNYISNWDHYFYLLGAVGVGPLVNESIN
ncbi:MAG: hypothetical protein KDH96_12195 [Candidatus Riesia sp.]|nr:hypothetical protein [Candidatus Riesia sp.]